MILLGSGLARLKCFVSRWACAIFVSELCFRDLLLGFRSFLFERHEGKFFVELALIVLFHVGLARLFVGFVLSEFHWISVFF